MARTQKNKATSFHLGQLKAKLAKLKRELLTPSSSGGGGDDGWLGEAAEVGAHRGGTSRHFVPIGGGGLVSAPHCKSGPYVLNGSTFITTAPNNESSVSVGAVGGNVGFLDGSVTWRNLREMKTNFASSYDLYYGIW